MSHNPSSRSQIPKAALVAGFISSILVWTAGCSETIALPAPQMLVGAFPDSVATSSETLLAVSVSRACDQAVGGVCTVCASLFPADGGDDGSLYDPRQPSAGAVSALALSTKGGEDDLVYRSPATAGARVISFLLFDGATACDGKATAVAESALRIDVTDDTQATPNDAGGDGGDQ